MTDTVRTTFWGDVRDALRGSHHDYTAGDLNRAIFLLAIPMVLEMVMESLFAVVDMFFVARLGTDATATIALTESILVLVYAVGIGLSMGTTAMVARRVGEKDQEGAAIAAVQAIVIGLAISFAVGVAGYLSAPELLRLMGGSDSLIATGSMYARIVLGSSFSVVMLFLLNAIFRGAGDAAIAMRVLWIANIINMLLDPCLIFGLGPFPELGVTGAAVATSFGRTVGVIYALTVLLTGTGRLRVRARHLVFVAEVAWRLLRISSNGIFQYLIATASWLALVRIIATFGSTPLAGYTIAIRIIMFSILPAWGLSNAAATLVGQNLGAGKPERAEDCVWRTGWFNMIFLGGIAVIFIVFAKPIIAIFTTDPPTAAIAIDCLRIIASGYFFYAWGMIVVQSFNGAGDTRTPTLINLFCYWLWQIPIAWLLSMTFGMGPRGVFIAVAIAESTLALAGVLAFRRGSWKHKKV